MALNSLICADVPLRNCSLSVCMWCCLSVGVMWCYWTPCLVTDSSYQRPMT